MDESEANLHRLITYANYTSKLSSLMNVNDIEHIESRVQSLIGHSDYQSFNSIKSEYDKIASQLRNAWFTENQIVSISRYPELIPINVHWLPVQVYYSIFLSLRAFSVASGQLINQNHRNTLTWISEEIRKHPFAFLYPWRLTYSGDPSEKDVFLNNVNIRFSKCQSVSPLALRSSGFDSVGLLLKTTRQRVHELRIDETKKNRKIARMKKEDKKQILSKMSPTTLYDFLYRMRIRSNYTDADSFIYTQQVPELSVMFSSLKEILWHGLLASELLIIKRIGLGTFKNMVNDFTNNDCMQITNETIDKRLNIYNKMIK